MPRLAALGPNWFGMVAGTGIVATAIALLPSGADALHPLALVAWGLATLLLVGLGVATALHWLLHPVAARGHLRNPSMAPFYGAPAIAILSVGSATLLVGGDVLGGHGAVRVAAVLWCAGTALGLWVICTVPRLLVRDHDLRLHDAFGGWLMPIVPLMVSAVTGAALVPHLPEGAAQTAMIALCGAFVAGSLAASLTVIGLVVARLLICGVHDADVVPTLWIVLGPLGSSVTAVNLLGTGDLGIAFGVTVLVLALSWLAVVGTITFRTAREGLPFTLAWWSFTFPVGTMVTGASQLAVHTGSDAFTVIAVALLALLLAGWTAAFARTTHWTLRGV